MQSPEAQSLSVAHGSKYPALPDGCGAQKKSIVASRAPSWHVLPGAHPASEQQKSRQAPVVSQRPDRQPLPFTQGAPAAPSPGTFRWTEAASRQTPTPPVGGDQHTKLASG